MKISLNSFVESAIRKSVEAYEQKKAFRVERFLVCNGLFGGDAMLVMVNAVRAIANFAEVP